MTRVYYKEAVGAFVVFDVTRSATFEAVQKWKNDIDVKVTLPDDRPIPVVLLANKCDLAPKDGFTQADEMGRFCEEHGFAAWFETSAKDNIGIDKAAKFLVQAVLDSDISRQEPDPDVINPGDPPGPGGEQATKKCCG